MPRGTYYNAIDCSANGSNTLVAAVPNYRIVVKFMMIWSNGTVTGYFIDGASPTGSPPYTNELSGPINFTPQTGFNGGIPYTEIKDGIMQTSLGNALTLYLSAGSQQVSGFMAYTLDPSS